MTDAGFQEDRFRTTEADRYYERNALHYDSYDPSEDAVFAAILNSGITPTSILDVGCADGGRLIALTDHFSCGGTGLEPATSAIDAARTRRPDLEWQVGTIDQLGSEHAQKFDLIVCSFVLHWVDRRLLLRSLAALDEAMRFGGILAIGDFHPDSPVKRRYHHVDDADVFTFKNDYAAMFTQTDLYATIFRAVHTYKDANGIIPGDRSDRWAITLLERRSDAHIREV